MKVMLLDWHSQGYGCTHRFHFVGWFMHQDLLTWFHHLCMQVCSYIVAKQKMLDLTGRYVLWVVIYCRSCLVLVWMQFSVMPDCLLSFLLSVIISPLSSVLTNCGYGSNAVKIMSWIHLQCCTFSEAFLLLNKVATHIKPYQTAWILLQRDWMQKNVCKCKEALYYLHSHGTQHQKKGLLEQWFHKQHQRLKQTSNPNSSIF
jgi:hypothetical protein